MHEASARNLRTVERFLLVPPLPAHFGTSAVSICDISARGARFRHDGPLGTGKKGVLRVPMEGRTSPLNLEAVVVWTQPEGDRFLSGVRTYGAPDVVHALISQLQTSNRSNRIEELRAADRFFIAPSLDARFGSDAVRIENLSARGARIELRQRHDVGVSLPLAFRVPDTTHDIVVSASVMWTSVKSVNGTGASSYRAGLLVATKPELMRLTIAQLCEEGRATLDTTSLGLKLKIMRARARQFGKTGESGVASEQFLLIQGVGKYDFVKAE